MTLLHPREAEREIVDCQAEQQQRLGLAVTAFSYPYGASNAALRRVVSRHFLRAYGARLGYVGPKSDRYALPRLDAYYLRDSRRLRLAVEGRQRIYLAARQVLRDVREAFGRFA